MSNNAKHVVMLHCKLLLKEWRFSPQFCTARLYWAGDNWSNGMNLWYKSCPWFRIHLLTCWSAVQLATTVLRLPLQAPTTTLLNMKGSIKQLLSYPSYRCDEMLNFTGYSLIDSSAVRFRLNLHWICFGSMQYVVYTSNAKVFEHKLTG